MTSNTCTLIYNIFCNHYQQLENPDQGVFISSISDHYPIFHIDSIQIPEKMVKSSSSSSNFISRRIQQNTFHMHNIIKLFHKCIPLAVAREAEAHQADNRYFNNDTAGGKQGARGDILLFPDVSSTLNSQNEWFNINGSDIHL